VGIQETLRVGRKNNRPKPGRNERDFKEAAMDRRAGRRQGEMRATSATAPKRVARLPVADCRTIRQSGGR
jgi:hypothetical protein